MDAALKEIFAAVQTMGSAGAVLLLWLFLRSETERKFKDKQLMEVTREAIETAKSATATIDMLRVALGTKSPTAPPGGPA